AGFMTFGVNLSGLFFGSSSGLPELGTHSRRPLLSGYKMSSSCFVQGQPERKGFFPTGQYPAAHLLHQFCQGL
ncbi:Hypothetical predicted protein, partial [Marmota monax]